MKPLLEGSLPARAATLLRSAASDVPPRTDAEKARLVSVVSAEAAKPEARSRLASGKRLGLLSLAAAVGLLGGAYSLSRSSPAPHVSVATTVPPASPAPSVEVAVPPRAPPSVVADAIDVTALPSAAPVKPSASHRSEPAATVTAPARAIEGAPRLEDELKAVDEARAAFVDKQPALALDRVASYRGRFPAGHFTAEIEALEIQALVALERHDEAQSKAARFLAEHPDSPYAQRVRSAAFAKK